MPIYCNQQTICWEEAIQPLSFARTNVIVIGSSVFKALDTYLLKIKTIIQKTLPIERKILFSPCEDILVLGAAYLLLAEHDSILQ